MFLLRCSFKSSLPEMKRICLLLFLNHWKWEWICHSQHFVDSFGQLFYFGSELIPSNVQSVLDVNIAIPFINAREQNKLLRNRFSCLCFSPMRDHEDKCLRIDPCSTDWPCTPVMNEILSLCCGVRCPKAHRTLSLPFGKPPLGSVLWCRWDAGSRSWRPRWRLR